MAEYKKGDVVMLKSGGPKMTVTGVEPNGDLSCVWFVGNKQSMQVFDPATVMAPPAARAPVAIQSLANRR